MKWKERINTPAEQPPNEAFAKLASEEAVQKAAQALEANGIEAFIVESGEEAKKKITELLPEGAEVFTSTSRTLDSLGIPAIVNEKYDSVRVKLSKMDPDTQQREMNKMGAVPEYMIGSVHAVTEGGSVVIASNTGSQLAGYAASAAHVIWVVGTQKVVPNVDEAIKRVYEYAYPLEDIRAQEAYGIHSNVSKMLIVNKEVNPERTKVIFVKEKLGY
jgi:L-lactate utilization protein LutC